MALGLTRRIGAAALMSFAGTTALHAAPGRPVEWQTGFQDPVTPVAEAIQVLDDGLLYVITAITLFVLALLAYVMWRFRESANPEPSRTTHNTMIEVAWTVIPVLILVGIAIPSFRLLYMQYDFPKPDVVVKAIGNQWYWSYEYPDEGEDVAFDANIVTDEDVLKRNMGSEAFDAKYGNYEGLERENVLLNDARDLWGKYKMIRLLSTDYAMVVPVNKVVHLLTTSRDVLHNWTVPSFGSKVDSVPGRVNATWFKATQTGTFYGQCSELCGGKHAYMPITVRVVEEPLYQKWLAARKSGDDDKIDAMREEIIQALHSDDKKSVASLAEKNN